MLVVRDTLKTITPKKSGIMQSFPIKKSDVNNHDIRIYLDGNLVDNLTAASPVSYHQDFHLGHYVNDGNEYFNGKLDDVRIYNRAINNDEAKILIQLLKKQIV